MNTHTQDNPELEKLFTESAQTFTPQPELKAALRDRLRVALTSSLSPDVPRGTGESARRSLVQKGIQAMKNRYSLLAAAAILVVAVSTAIALLTVGNVGVSVAWADVQQRIRNIRTLTCKITMQPKSGPRTVGKMMMMEPGLIRHESTKPMKGVTIIDLQKGKMITLMLQQKKVMRVNMSGSEDAMKDFLDRFVIAHLKKLIEESESELGEKEINGQTVKGYRVEKKDMKATIWVDAETCALLEMEMTVFRGEMKMAMTDFEFDKELDEKLFSLEVPEGYTEWGPSITLKAPAFEDVAVLLRVMARMKGDVFPGALPEDPSMAAYMKHLKGFDRVLGGQEAKKVVMPMGRGIMFLAKIHPSGHYTGKGVKLGDREAMIFWYQPKGAKTYRVIYGDLSIRNVEARNLPKQSAHGK